MNDVTNRKILSICQLFSVHQYITEPTHFTEISYSLLDIILVSNKNSVITCGAGSPFLTQDIRYHCPVYGILKFSKPKISLLNVKYGLMTVVTTKQSHFV